MEPTDNGDLPVTINCNLAALRLLHKLRDGLFCVLMDTLLLNDLV